MKEHPGHTCNTFQFVLWFYVISNKFFLPKWKIHGRLWSLFPHLNFTLSIIFFKRQSLLCSISCPFTFELLYPWRVSFHIPFLSSKLHLHSSCSPFISLSRMSTDLIFLVSTRIYDLKILYHHGCLYWCFITIPVI